MANHYPSLNQEKALIWRIIHRDNLRWILDNGLHCANADGLLLLFLNGPSPEFNPNALERLNRTPGERQRVSA